MKIISELRILRGRVIESGANTSTVKSFRTPIDIPNRIGMVIHKIFFDPASPSPNPSGEYGGEATVNCALVSNPFHGDPHQSGFIAKGVMGRYSYYGRDGVTGESFVHGVNVAGNGTWTQDATKFPMQHGDSVQTRWTETLLWDFPVPLPYLLRRIWGAVTGSGNTVAEEMSFVIYYQLAEFTEAEWISYRDL